MWAKGCGKGWGKAWGKGWGKGMGKPEESIQSVEAKLTQANDALYEKALDLNASQTETATAVTALLNLRQQLLALYGVAPDPAWSPGTMVHGGAGAGALGAPAAFTWVGKLNEVMCKALKRPMTKGEVTYTTVAADETGKSYITTVSSAHFKGEYSGASPSISKKGAEHAAARVAMEAEYPAAFAQLESIEGVAMIAPAGTKRKAPGAASNGPPEGKSQLSHYAQMLLQRSATKEDIVYVVAPTADGRFSATVTLPSYQGSPSYTGEGANQKEAEMNAARSACAELEPLATPLIEEHKAKKAAKMREGLTKLKQSQEAKKVGVTAVAA